MATILIVEDQADIRDMVRLWLEMDDHEVFEAENGQVGVEQVLELKPDITLMDMHMPVMDGHEAVEVLRKEHGYQGLIIAVTASAMKTDVDRVKETGCNGFIPKPIGEDFGELVNGFLTEDR
uniref:Putative polar-differentiation response regulator DivK. [divK] n=1 Tax=Magnetococcus massalia (strain MO-1) TaxID=451514 RepID=A0A1S7LFL0_MAGMO|nr:Putative polar-differentiation response regulator DivK [divK] [Candidatus Magnetococcus massalia]